MIRDGVDTDFWQLINPFPDRDELIELCNQHGKIFETNEHYKYTNVGYSLLGMVIEAASGQRYHDYVRDRIIGPLGLLNTGPEYEADRKAQYAAGHTGLLDGAEPREVIGHIDTRGMAAATGFYSTAEDLTRYGAAHFFGKEQGSYGLGMDLKTIGSRQWVGHSGGYPGHITRTYIDPHGRAVVSVLTNCIGGPATQLAEGVIKLLELAHDAPEEQTAPDGVDLRSLTGRRIRSGRRAGHDLTRRDGIDRHGALLRRVPVAAGGVQGPPVGADLGDWVGIGHDNS